jgi:hypothetical protein
MEESRSARLLRQIKEVCEVAGIRTEEYAKVTKKRLDVLSLTRELGRERAALGERVYDLARRRGQRDVLEDVTVQAVMGRISNLEATLASCETEISTIHNSAQARATDVRRRYDEDGAPGQPRTGGAEGGTPADPEGERAARAAAEEAELAGALEVDPLGRSPRPEGPGGEAGGPAEKA